MEDRAFRRALGEFATGVAVVTARGRGEELIGMTMSSFNSVSIDPPLVLFCVDRKARSLPAMLEARGFAINVLAAITSASASSAPASRNGAPGSFIGALSPMK